MLGILTVYPAIADRFIALAPTKVVFHVSSRARRASCESIKSERDPSDI